MSFLGQRYTRVPLFLRGLIFYDGIGRPFYTTYGHMALKTVLSLLFKVWQQFFTVDSLKAARAVDKILRYTNFFKGGRGEGESMNVSGSHFGYNKLT